LTVAPKCIANAAWTAHRIDETKISFESGKVSRVLNCLGCLAAC